MIQQPLEYSYQVPLSDLSAGKKRGALVVATLTGDDVILCQITRQAVADNYAVPLTDRDFTHGSLRQRVTFAQSPLYGRE